MRGGSVESEMYKVMQTAREKGADAVQMKSVEQPDFSNANFRLVADLLRYTDTWETITISEGEFAAYLKANQRSLDPIEGIWNTFGRVPHRIGIMRDTSKPGRDFVGFILDTENPTWRDGYKKIDIRARTHNPGLTSSFTTSTISANGKPPSFWAEARRSRWPFRHPRKKPTLITYSRSRYIP